MIENTGNSNPTFLLGFGAAKSGTTWLYSYLKSNEIVSFYRLKEPHSWTLYFEPSISFRYYSLIEKLQKYSTAKEELIESTREKLIVELEECLFSLRPNSYLNTYYELAMKTNKPVGDLTTDYSRLTCDQIRQVKTFLMQRFNVKALFIMRDPARRLFSQFKHNYRQEIEEIIHQGKYNDKELSAIVNENYKRMLEREGSLSTTMRADYQDIVKSLEVNFDKINLKIVFYEDLFTKEVITEICDYLDASYIKPIFNDRINRDPFNVSLNEQNYNESVKKLNDVYRFTRFKYKNLPKTWGQFAPGGI